MFTTLDDLKKSKGEDKQKKTEAYSGGQKSGMAVEHPGDDLVNKAKEDMGKEVPRAEGEVHKITLALYRNGFQVNGGEFRDFKEPGNQEFMDTLKKNRLPLELAKKYPDGNVDFNLEDHRDEDYTPPPPPKYVAYSGTGHSLGGEEVKAESLGVNVDAGIKPDVDTSKETTKIQIKFHNGERVAHTFNVDQRVSDIHTYVMTAAPVDGSYVLIRGFPPKPLDNPSLTIAEAKLKGAQITQKLV